MALLRHALATLTILLGAANLSTASTLRLVENLGDHVPAWAGSQPYALATVGGRVTFLAQPADDSGLRLFATDGSSEGTLELPVPGMDGLATTGLLAGTLEGLALYELQASDVSHLWATDGTEAGTRLLRTAPGSEVPYDYDTSRALSVRRQSTLFFFALDGGWEGTLELWRSDGTAATTSRVIVFPAALNTVRLGPVATDSGLFFFVLSGPGGTPQALWRSDGTAAGTFELLPAIDGRSFDDLEGLAERVVLVERLGDQPALWASDGTVAATAPIADLAGIRRFWSSGSLAADGRTALFTRSGSAGGMEVWLTRGDPASTRRVAAIDDHSESEYAYGLAPATTFAGGRALLPIADAERRLDLWSVDLESGATDQVATIGTPLHNLTDAVSDGGRALFSVAESGGRSTVWSSDGTGAGTTRLFQAAEPGAFDEIRFGTPLAGRTLFTFHRNAAPTIELWSTDGTAEGTRLLEDNLTQAWRGFGFAEPSARDLARLGQASLFAAADPHFGWEPWRADAQAAVRVADLRLDRPGVDWLAPLGEIDEELYFAVSDPFTRSWQIRAAPLVASGSRLLFERPYQCGRHGCDTPRRVHAIGARRVLFLDPSDYTPSVALGFDAESGDSENLFPSEGTSYGWPLGSDAFASNGKLLLLAARNDRPGIFATDGTAGGTHRLLSLAAGGYHSSLGRRGDRWLLWESLDSSARLRALDLETRALELLLEVGASYLDAVARTRDGVGLLLTRYGSSAADRRDLYWSDGTAAGTRLALTLPFTPQVSTAASSEAATVLVSTSDYPAGPSELWSSDGTPERSRLLRTVPDALLYLKGSVVPFRGALYFVLVVQRSGESSIELWRTDGSPEGTSAVVSFPSYDGSTYLTDLQPVAGRDRLYLTGHDPEHGIEPWSSDGTPEGTALLADLEPGSASSSPGPMVRFGDRVFFSAAAADFGRELWSAGGPGSAAELVADHFPGTAGSFPEFVGALGGRPLLLADDGIVGREPWTLEEPDFDPCTPTARSLCVTTGRFRVSATWRKFDGVSGAATAVPLTAESGYLWFFDAANPELFVKVLDACGVPEARNFWTFTTGLTDVEVALTIEDSATGETRRIETGMGEPFVPAFDAGSFHVCEAAPAKRSGAGDAATSVGTVLPLLGGRFEAEVHWSYPDASGSGQAVALSDQAGYFWFFDPANVELLVKVLDGCPLEPYPAYWVFTGGLTDLEVELTLRDLLSGRSYAIATPGGVPFPPSLDTGAFPTCP